MTLCISSGFTYSIHQVYDGKYGGEVNGTWNGMIGEILRDEADMAVAPLTVNFRRAEQVDFTKPFLSLGISILFRIPGPLQPGLFSFLNPLAVDIWLYILVSIVVITISLFVIGRITPYEWYQEKRVCQGHVHITPSSLVKLPEGMDCPPPPPPPPMELKNHYSFTNTVWYIHIEREESHGAKSCLNFITHYKLAIFTLLLIVFYSATGGAAMAYIFQVSFLPGSPFVKFAVYGLLRTWIPFAIFFADRYLPSFGRRKMFLIPMTTVFLCYLFVVIAMQFTTDPKIIFGGTLAGAVICNCLWIALGQYSIELFPTTVRGTASSITGVCDPIMGVIMPQLIYLEKYWKSLPFMLVTFFTGLAALLGLVLLPETKDRSIPDTIEDLDAIDFAYKRWGRRENFSVNSGGARYRWSQLKESCCGDAEADALIADTNDGDDVLFTNTNGILR